jgi:rubrerythrin
MRGRIRELEGEFHVEWLMNRWVGRCGHRWARLETKSPEQCPICELIAKGRPKGLVKRVAELSFYG